MVILETFTRTVGGLPLLELGKSRIFPSIDIDGGQQSHRMDLESDEG
jgi:hypothetical protein